MAGFEAFTVMAVLDAQDRASRIIEKVSGTIEEFSKIMDEAAKNAETAGAAIDQSLLETASGADALALANDRVEASQAKLTLATQKQAKAEQNLMDARAKGLGDAELAAAGDKLTQSEKDAAKASAELKTAQEQQQAVTRALKTDNEELAASEEAASTASTGWIGIVVAAAAAVAVAGGMSVKAAGDFQAAVTHLVTDGGEAKGAIDQVSSGMLNMSSQVGASAEDLAKGMYHIESAGFHAAKGGLDVLRVAAEGAKVGNADLDTVSKTLAGTLDAYGKGAGDATSFMNQLIETTAQGDMRMQDLAASLGNVAPIAAKAGLDFSQVGGAIATMTSQNMTAAQSTQNLANLIQHLSNPIGTQRTQMQAMGIDINDLTEHLGDRGLTGTLDILYKAIADHTQNGQVFIQTLQDSKSAAADANTMFGTMTPDLKKLSEQLENGSLSVKDYRKAFEEMGPASARQGNQFLTLEERMGGFNKLLASGSPEAESYNAALATLTGGQIGLRTALMLSTENGQYFSDATQKIAEASKDASGSVKNWDVIQGTFNQKADQAKAALEAMAIRIGTMILPYVEKIVAVFSKAADWFIKNKLLVEGLAVSLGVTLGTALVVVGAIAGTFIAVLNLLGLIFLGIYKGVVWLAGEIEKAWKYISKVTEKLWKDAVKFVEGLEKDLKKVWKKISDEVESVWDGIANFFKKWWPLLYMIFATPIFILQAMWHKFHEDIMSVVTPTWNWISNTAAGAWHWLVKEAESSWNWIYKNIVDPVSGAIDWVDRHINEIGDSISSAFTSILNWLNGVYDSFNSVGENIMIGIWNGIVGRWDWLMNKVSNLANDLLNTAKNAIGVQSPSKKFADEFGEMIPAGIAVGIQNGSRTAHNAMENLSNSLSATSGMSAVGGISALGAGAAGGGPTVIIDVRNSQLMSERDMDVFVDRVGRRLATRVLPAGGVRIRG